KLLPATPPDQLRPGCAENPLRLLVDIGEDPVLVDRYETVADALEDSGDLPVRTLEILLRPASISDIPADSRGADDIAGCVADRRHSRGDVYQAAILAAPYGIMMNGRLPAAQAFQIVEWTLGRSLGNQD